MTITLQVLLALGVLGAILLVRWRRSWPSFLLGSVSLLALTIVVTGLNALLTNWQAFSSAQFAAPVLLATVSVYALASAFLLWNAKRALSMLSAALAITVAGVGLDAFVIEPRWLEVTHTEITSPRVHERLRIVLLADIQFEDFGEHELAALKRTMAAEPDLIVFAGDYIQSQPSKYQQQRDRFRRAIDDVGLAAPLGVYAVQGDVERPDWLSIFTGLPITALTEDTTIFTGRFALTLLSLGSSANPALSLEREADLHVVLGHRPDYSLGEIEADLLLAGHIHGGQVHVPFYGPPITFSKVPRDWSSGHTRIKPGQDLYVSRGIGLERGNAPRLRFLARPELAVIDVLPVDETVAQLPQ